MPDFDHKWIRYEREVYSAEVLKSYLDDFKTNLGVESLEPCHRILDVGCGPCRVFEIVSPTSEYWGVDESSVVDIARKRYGKNDNFHVIRGDMLDLNFEEKFDLIIALATLHHTENTEKAFKYLAGYLAPRGEYLAYIYNKKAPMREWLDDLIRSQTTRMTDQECEKFAKKMTNVGRELSKSKITIKGLPLQRWIFYNVFKCWWNDDYPYDYSVCVNYDWSEPSAHWVRCRK